MFTCKADKCQFYSFVAKIHYLPYLHSDKPWIWYANTITVVLSAILLYSLHKQCWTGPLAVSDWPNVQLTFYVSVVLVANIGSRPWFVHQHTPVCLFFGEGNTIYHVDSSRESSSESVKVNTNVSKMLASFFLSLSAPFCSLCKKKTAEERKSNGDDVTRYHLCWTANCQQLSVHCRSPHLSVGLFIRCLNLLALIVAAGGQEHEDRVFIRACTTSQTEQTKVDMSPVIWDLFLFIFSFLCNTTIPKLSSVYPGNLCSWVLTSWCKNLDECKTSY